MDPKLQHFLATTGWSKEDLIRKLSSSEGSVSAVLNEIDYVTSTTSNQDKLRPWKKSITTLQRIPKIISKNDQKASERMDNAKIVDIDLKPEGSLPQSASTSFLLDDFLLHLNTANSYLTSSYNKDSPPRTSADQSGVIDLVSDAESLDLMDLEENDPQTRSADDNIIDISTDSDESVKLVKSSSKHLDESERRKRLLIGAQTVSTRLIGKDTFLEDASSKSDHNRRDRYGTERDSSQHRDKHKEKPYRYRSPSESRSHKERQHRKAAHDSTNGKRQHKKKSKKHKKSNSESRGKSRTRSRSRRRSRSGSIRSRSGRVLSRSISRRSRSRSIGRHTSPRSRKRTRSISRENDFGWQCKTNQEYRQLCERRSHSNKHLKQASYYSRETSPPKDLSDYLSDVSTDSTLTFKDDRKRKRKLLPHTSIDLSKNNIPGSYTFTTFKKNVIEKYQNSSLTTAAQKIQLKRRHVDQDSNYKQINKTVITDPNTNKRIDKCDISETIVIGDESPPSLVKTETKSLSKLEGTTENSTNTIESAEKEPSTQLCHKNQNENIVPNNLNVQNDATVKEIVNGDKNDKTSISQSEILDSTDELEKLDANEDSKIAASNTDGQPLISEDIQGEEANQGTKINETNDKIVELPHLAPVNLSDLSDITSGDLTDDMIVNAKPLETNAKDSNDKMAKVLNSQQAINANDSKTLNVELSDEINDAVAEVTKPIEEISEAIESELVDTIETVISNAPDSANLSAFGELTDDVSAVKSLINESKDQNDPIEKDIPLPTSDTILITVDSTENKETDDNEKADVKPIETIFINSQMDDEEDTDDELLNDSSTERNATSENSDPLDDEFNSIPPEQNELNSQNNSNQCMDVLIVKPINDVLQDNQDNSSSILQAQPIISSPKTPIKDKSEDDAVVNNIESQSLTAEICAVTDPLIEDNKDVGSIEEQSQISNNSNISPETSLVNDVAATCENELESPISQTMEALDENEASDTSNGDVSTKISNVLDEQNLTEGSANDQNELKSSNTNFMDSIVAKLSSELQTNLDSSMDVAESIQNDALIKPSICQPNKPEMSDVDTISKPTAHDVSDDDTPSLDIEAILKKCQEHQEKILKKAVQSLCDNIPPSVVRVRPKNRRPDFRALRDNSISTIQINKMLEQLSHYERRPETTTASLVPPKTEGKTIDGSSAKGQLTSLRSITENKNLSEAMKSSQGTSKDDKHNFVVPRQPCDFGKPFYDKNINDDVRNEILKQLEMLKNRRKDDVFSTSIIPATVSKTIRKKTLAKLQEKIVEHDADDEEINIVNENLDAPIIWLTKTADYKKIKGWKNKSIGIKATKSSESIAKTIEEDFAVPSCSFHHPSFVDDIIENVVSDNINETETECTPSTEPGGIIEDDAFSSSILDEFLLDKSEVELKISFEVPKLIMGPRINESGKIYGNLLKGDLKYSMEAATKKDLIINEGTKPRTLAEKRKLLIQESQQNPMKPTMVKPLEVNKMPYRQPARRSVNDDMPNTGHNKRKDFAVGGVYWRGKRFLVPCRERKTIYFRNRIVSRYANINSHPKDESASKLNTSDGSPIRKRGPTKAILWSPEKIIQRPVLQSVKNQKQNIAYKAGPMCKKPELILDTSKSWQCIVKSLPKVYLEITAEYGKSLHPRAMQFLYADPMVDLSQEKVDFALTALKDSNPTKFTLPVSYEKGQTQLTLRQHQMIEIGGAKTPPLCGDISSEVKEVVDDLLSCIEIQDIQDTFIKEDPDFEVNAIPKQITKSPNKKDSPGSSVTTRVAAINKSLRLALSRLQVKFIDINIDEDPNKACEKTYCQLGCVCSSLLGALSSKEHCRRIECVFGCICGYKPPPNTTVTLPAGSDLDLSSTVDKLQSEATKNLAKVEKEFTQTIVCTKNETYVLGDTVDRKRRCTRAPKKYEDFMKAKDVTSDNEDSKQAKEESSITNSDYVRTTYGIEVTDCSVRIEKVDMYHIIPFCWRHEEYQCQCLKEFLIARSQEKANNLALQLDNVDANKDSTDDNLTIHGLLGSKWNKTKLIRKSKRTKKNHYLYQAKRRYQLKLKAVQAAAATSQQFRGIKNLNALQDTSPIDVDAEDEKGNMVTYSAGPGCVVESADINKLGNQESQQTKPSSRRKQVLSTMVDISEKGKIQIRKRKELIQPKTVTKITQNADRDALRFMLPTSNVRLQFLKMLGKDAESKDEFRLLSFMVLSNRFHRLLCNVWYSRSETTAAKYILTMDNARPSPDYLNVRYFPKDMKSDNYLIQWLLEGSIPVAEVQDFLVILRVIELKRFDICGMCEKSKIEYTDEPLLPPSPPVTIPTPRLTSVVSTNNSRQVRKILNIQNRKIPTISCTYQSVALTAQSGLIHASLPSITAKYRWLMLCFSSTFAVLNMTTTNYCIPHEFLVELVEQSRLTNCTIMYKNREIRGQAVSADFAIYVTPQHKKYFFIGPYHINEERTCETLCYYKNMLVSTENFNKIHRNPVTPVGCWVKQLQMKIHTVSSLVSIPNTATPPTTSTVTNIAKTVIGIPKTVMSIPRTMTSTATTVAITSKTITITPSTATSTPPLITTYFPTRPWVPILPKPMAVKSSPLPQLVKISDFMAAKRIKPKGKHATLIRRKNSSPKTSFLIVNNSIVSGTPRIITTAAIKAGVIGDIALASRRANETNVAVASPASTSTDIAAVSPECTPNNEVDPLLLPYNNASEDIRLVGLDYRDAEFKDASTKALQYLVTNIPGFGYVRIYRCLKSNIIYLMWRYVKTYRTLLEAKKALILLIESTVIIAPNDFKITVTLLNAKPSNLKLLNSDYFFDTYIAGKFGVHLLSNFSLRSMVEYRKLSEEDVAYINDRSSGMLLKKCYNIASTFLTKDDLTHIRNWKDMMTALKTTIDFERQTERKLVDILNTENKKQIILQQKLNDIKNDCEDGVSIIDVTPVKATSEVIEISDEDGDELLTPKFEPADEQQATLTPVNLPEGNLIEDLVKGINPSPISNKIITTNTQQRSIGFVSMAQNFKGAFKLLPHNQNSVLITRIKSQPTNTKTNY